MISIVQKDGKFVHTNVKNQLICYLSYDFEINGIRYKKERDEVRVLTAENLDDIVFVSKLNGFYCDCLNSWVPKELEEIMNIDYLKTGYEFDNKLRVYIIINNDNIELYLLANKLKAFHKDKRIHFPV